MTGLLLFLALPSLLALLLGLGVGWAGRLVPEGKFWRLAWGVGALFLPALSLSGYLHETVLAAGRSPQWADVWHLFQAQLILLFALVAGLTLWGTWRGARWTPLPLLALLPVFYELILPAIFGNERGSYDEILANQLGGDTNRGLLLLCLSGAALLAGMGLAGRRKTSPTPHS